MTAAGGITKKMEPSVTSTELYLTVDGVKTKATRWSPDSAGKVGGIVACHGGVTGLDAPMLDACVRLAAAGLVVLAPHYRGEDNETTYRDIGASDVADALAATCVLAGEVPRVAVWGQSRGGLVALLALSARPDLFAGAAVTSPIDSVAFLHDVMAERGDAVAAEIALRLGGTPMQVPGAYAARDAAKLAAKCSGRPLFLAHAADDVVVPASRSLELLQRWHGTCDITAVLTREGGHRVVYDTDGPVWRGLVRFLGDLLGEPTTPGR
jgi:dipeptidyl aminopeptidase/acylaminoacyl peptidase